MPSPQKEDGYTPIANELVEALAKINLSAYESRVLWAILRKTYGWHKPGDYISHSQFIEITNLDERNIIRSLNQLVKRHIITRVSKTKKGINAYGLQKDYSKWS